jgi:hypothetical protein
LFAGLKILLQLIFPRPLIIEDGEGRLGWLGAAISSGGDGIVLGVIVPLAADPMGGELVGEGSLSTIV